MKDVAPDLEMRLRESSRIYNRTLDACEDGVFLYGAGFVGKWSLDYLENAGIPILGFVDSDEAKWGSKVSGYKVHSPTAACIKDAKAILITSRHAVPPIKCSLSHLTASIMSVDAFVVHHEGQDRIHKVESLFSRDKESLKTFRAVLLAMLDGSTEALAPHADNRPFFDRFGFFNRDGEVFVDAGAFVGDSIERFLWSVNGVFREVHAFEPGRRQFRALQARVDRLVSEWALNPDSISLVNKGLSSASGTVRVSEGAHPIQTRVELDSDPAVAVDEVHTVTLDEYFNGREFTFLKVDVEGSEADLLAGGSASISRYRPRIALSVYHYPTDIFDLPLQCRALNANYLFGLGHHSSQLMDTVLYCRDRDD